jgi:hypothetical protein
MVENSHNLELNLKRDFVSSIYDMMKVYRSTEVDLGSGDTRLKLRLSYDGFSKGLMVDLIGDEYKDWGYQSFRIEEKPEGNFDSFSHYVLFGFGAKYVPKTQVVIGNDLVSLDDVVEKIRIRRRPQLYRALENIPKLLGEKQAEFMDLEQPGSSMKVTKERLDEDAKRHRESNPHIYLDSKKAA